MDDAQFYPAPGIAYQTLDGISGRYFECLTMRATLTPRACALNFAASTVLGEGRYASCHRCKIGRARAGEKAGSESVDVGWRCCRCGPSGQSRIIGGTLCVSCYNRTREVISLRDGRGSIPVGILEQLRPAWAIVGELPPTDADTPSPYVPLLDTSRKLLAAVPSVYRMAPGRFLLVVIVESLEELHRTIRRKLPGVQVMSAGVEPTLLEFHEVGIRPDEWLRAGVG